MTTDRSKIACLCGCGGYPSRNRDYINGHRPHPSFAEALRSHLIQLPGCWGWHGSTNKKGYGLFRYRGVTYLAHRAMWLATLGHLADDAWVLHRCDNPPCTNPEHLFLGDVRVNNQDMVAKGRMPRGEKRTQSKLTEEIVVAIRQRYANGELQKPLADEYGVAPITISSIVRRATWRHV